MRLIFFPIFLFLISCESKEKNPQKTKTAVPPNPIDSSITLRNAIQGKWYLPGNTGVVMEIKGNSVEYMEGFLEVRYSIINNRFLLLFNPDETVDTVETKIISDTLYQREPGSDSFTKYTRHP